MGRHLRSAGLGSAGLSCPGRDVTLGCADTEHLCSAPHPPPATPSRRRTRPDVCLFSSVDFPALRAEAALRAGWEGSPALAGGISLPLPCCRRSGRSASRSARRLSLSPGVPGRGRRCPQPFPREPARLSALGDDDDSSGVPQEAVLGAGSAEKAVQEIARQSLSCQILACTGAVARHLIHHFCSTDCCFWMLCFTQIFQEPELSSSTA